MFASSVLAYALAVALLILTGIVIGALTAKQYRRKERCAAFTDNCSHETIWHRE